MTIRRLRPDSTSASAFDWNIDSVVTELRSLREASLAARRRLGQPAKLPSRRALSGIMDGLRAALFPNRLSSRELDERSVDFFVGHTLDLAIRELVDQLVREFEFVGEGESPVEGYRDRAIRIAQEFAARLPDIRTVLETDIRAAHAADPAARSIDEVLACYPGVVAITHYRVAHVLFGLGAQLVARMIGELAHSETGVDIHPAARIGGSFFIDHGTGVVIGETSVIGDRVRMNHAVTLGARRQTLDDAAAAPDTPRHPIVEDDVVIYSGATLLGPIRIGRGSIIGGNVWLTTSVPPASHIAQAEVRREVFDEGLGI